MESAGGSSGPSTAHHREAQRTNSEKMQRVVGAPAPPSFQPSNMAAGIPSIESEGQQELTQLMSSPSSPSFPASSRRLVTTLGHDSHSAASSSQASLRRSSSGIAPTAGPPHFLPAPDAAAEGRPTAAAGVGSPAPPVLSLAAAPGGSLLEAAAEQGAMPVGWHGFQKGQQGQQQLNKAFSMGPASPPSPAIQPLEQPALAPFTPAQLSGPSAAARAQPQNGLKPTGPSRPRSSPPNGQLNSGEGAAPEHAGTPLQGTSLLRSLHQESLLASFGALGPGSAASDYPTARLLSWGASLGSQQQELPMPSLPEQRLQPPPFLQYPSRSPAPSQRQCGAAVAASPHTAASSPLETPRSLCQEASLLLEQAEAQGAELWGLLDKLVAAKDSRAREAEHLAWEARYELRRAERRAREAEELAGHNSEVVRGAMEAVEQAQQAQHVLQEQMDNSVQEAQALREALAGAQAELKAAREEAQVERERWEGRDASLKARLERAEAEVHEGRQREAALLVEVESEAQRVQQAERWQDELAQALEQLKGELAARDEELAEAEAHHAQQLSSLHQQLAEQSAQFQCLSAAAEAAQREGAAASARAEVAAAQSIAAERRCEAAEAEREGALHQLRTADEEVQRLTQEAMGSSLTARQALSDLAMAQAAAERQRQAGEAAGARLREREVQLAAAQGLVRDRGAELEARELEIRQLQVTVQEASRQGEAAQAELSGGRHTLRMLQSEKADLQEGLQVQGAELASLHAAHAELQGRVRCMEGEEAACREHSLPELEHLVGLLEAATPRLRDLVTERRIEAARSEVAAASQLTCIVCCAAPRDTFLNCGHLICRACAERLAACPVCRVGITSRTRAFV